MNFGIWELVIILVIVALLFGTAKLRNIGGDLGSALRSFRSALKDDSEDDKEATGDKTGSDDDKPQT
ncbi:MAG: Sec-independent protein translocase subunit TatA [Gammaproteobacteria bacterium]|nr:Sec-independent protein translocase subunit TatA [Gammaproteobacteria bacterium]